MATTVAQKKKTCFVICPIGPEGSEERKRSDQALKYVFERALTQLGYEVTRADKIAEPGMITTQVLQRIIEADLVLADMSGQNANVFYELAVRHAVQKPIVHVIGAGQRIPFDVAGLRTISISLSLEGAEQAITDIKMQVEQIEAGNVGDTPLKLAAIVQQLGKNPGDEILGEILNASMAIRSDLRRIPDWQDLYTRLTGTAFTGMGLVGTGSVPLSALRSAGFAEVREALGGSPERQESRQVSKRYGGPPVSEET